MLEKPNELVLYRDPKDGGLGLINVEIRALACLIRTFMETAANKSFKHSLFHEHLYRFHVKGECSLPDPGFTPFYDAKFFEIIKVFYEQISSNVANMSLKQWYLVLLENKVLMSLHQQLMEQLMEQLQRNSYL